MSAHDFSLLCYGFAAAYFLKAIFGVIKLWRMRRKP